MKEHHVLRELRMALDLVRPDAERAAEHRRRARQLLESFIHGHTTAEDIIELAKNGKRH